MYILICRSGRLRSKAGVLRSDFVWPSVVCPWLAVAQCAAKHML
jgi:hypothetical protein